MNNLRIILLALLKTFFWLSIGTLTFSIVLFVMLMGYTCEANAGNSDCLTTIYSMSATIYALIICMTAIFTTTMFIGFIYSLVDWHCRRKE